MTGRKQIYFVIHKQYGNEAEAFTVVYPFTSRLAAARRMVKLMEAAEKAGNYVSPVHYSDWGRFKGFNQLNIDSFHVSMKHCNEQSVELVASPCGEPFYIKRGNN